MDIHLKFAHDSLDEHNFQVTVIHHIKCNMDGDDDDNSDDDKVDESSRDGPSYIEFNAIQFHNVRVRDVTDDSDSSSSSSLVVNNCVQHTYDGEIIRVLFEKAWKSREHRRIEISYTVDSPLSSIAFHYKPKQQGEKQQKQQQQQQQIPTLGKYAVTDHETERARFWLACVDYPVLRPTMNFYFTIPVEWSAYANGVLKSESVLSDDTSFKLVEWSNTYPCPSYLICFAVGELMIVRDEDVTTMDGKTLPIAYIAPRGTNEQDLKLTFNKTRSIIKYLEDRIQVPFPDFGKYYQVIAPRVSSAMENISLVSWDNMFLQDENYAKEWKVETDIVVLHECSHSYFGDALVIRHFEHAWLKESFAKFFEATWAGHEYGHNERMYELYLQKVSYTHEADHEYVRPIVTNKYDSSWDLFDRHLYPGGSWRLHMLMNLLGEKVFWRGIKNYVQQFYSSGIVETIDLQRALERVSKRNLTKFFEQWIYGCGYPVLNMKYTYDMKKKTVKLLARQTQMNKSRNIHYFDMDLKVKVLTEKGEFDGTLTFANYEAASLTLSVDSEPTMILFDPSTELLFKIEDNFDPGQTILLNVLRNAPDIFNRIFAAHQFIKHHASTSKLLMNDLIESLKTEAHYGVRAQIAHSLSENKSIHAARALCWMLEHEKEPMAHMQVTKSMIEFRDDTIKQSVLNYLKRADQELLPYITHGNALNALASQRLSADEEREAIDLILNHIDSDKQEAYPVVRLLGYGALKHFSQSKVVYDHLVQRLTTEPRQECTGTILRSIGTVASTLESPYKDEAVKLLVDHLRDEDDNVKYGAIRGLVAIGDTGVVDDLKQCMKRFAHQFRPWVQRQIIALSHKKTTTGPRDESLRKEVEKLKETVEKLREQIADTK